MSSLGRPVLSFVFLRLPSKFPSQMSHPDWPPAFCLKRPWLASHTCADMPKILKLERCMNVHLCVHKSESSCICVHAWMCQSHQGVSSMQRLLFLAFGHFHWFAGGHGLLPPPLKTQTLSDSASPLFCLVSVLRSHQANKVTDIELGDKYVYKCCASCLLKMLILVALHVEH